MTKSNYIKDVGARIRYARTKQKLTLDDMAEKTGLHKSTLSRYENGEIAMELSKVQDIANALGVSASYLCGWKTNEEVEAESLVKQIINLSGGDLSDDEVSDLLNYVQFIISKRKKV